MPKQQRTEPVPARYRGLTAKQIRALIEIDELARGAHDAELTTAVEQRYRHDLGQPLTVARMREYAQEAETADLNGVTHAWYEAIDKHREATAADHGSFRSFLVRVGWLEEARKHGYELTPDEMRPIAERRLREAQRSDFDGRLPGALTLFEKLRDRDGIRRVLARAVVLGRHDIATRAAQGLGRTLRRNELLRIARRKIREDRMYFRDAAAFLTEHALHKLYRPLIDGMAKSRWVSFAQLRALARRLRVTLTTSQLERCHRMHLSHNLDTRSVVSTAHALAKRSAAWRRRLPEIYAWCRGWGISYREPEIAEQYGKKCGQPLTIAELQTMAEHFTESGIEHLDWAVKHREFCLDLAAQRIAEASSTPPDPPVEERAVA